MNKKILLLTLILGVVVTTGLGGCSILTALMPQAKQTPQSTQVSQQTQTTQTPQATLVPQSTQTTQVKQTPRATQTPQATPQTADGKVTGKKIAYITIDDGPSRNNTVKNLDTLKKYGIKATFFVLPKKGVDDVYKRIFDEGHEIGNHSYSHDTSLKNANSLYTDIKFFEEDLLKARKMIEDKLGYTTEVYRFPGGTMGKDKAMIAERVKILEKYGYKYYNWNVTTGDTDPGPASKVKLALVNNVLNNTKGRNKLIILMHDTPDKNTTTEALPDIIEGLKNQGYTFDVLSNY